MHLEINLNLFKDPDLKARIDYAVPFYFTLKSIISKTRSFLPSRGILFVNFQTFQQMKDGLLILLANGP